MKSADLRTGTVYVGSRGGPVPFAILSTDTFRQFSSRGQNRSFVSTF